MKFRWCHCPHTVTPQLFILTGFQKSVIQISITALKTGKVSRWRRFQFHRFSDLFIQLKLKKLLKLFLMLQRNLLEWLNNCKAIHLWRITKARKNSVHFYFLISKTINYCKIVSVQWYEFRFHFIVCTSYRDNQSFLLHPTILFVYSTQITFLFWCFQKFQCILHLFAIVTLNPHNTTTNNLACLLSH